MKAGHYLVGVSLLATMLGGTIKAQELRQPASVLLMSHEVGYFADPAVKKLPTHSPSDKAPGDKAPGKKSPSDAAPKETAPAQQIEPIADNDTFCVTQYPPSQPGRSHVCNHRHGGACPRGSACSLGKPWTLPQPCSLKRLGIRAGGWLQQGITFNGDNVADHFNGPVATNDWDHEYQMNQLWLYLDRPANNGGHGWAVGGHADVVYGTDWRFGINQGLEDNINGFNFQSYGIVIPQLYFEVALNKLSVKIGHFASILDYEAIPAPLNHFYSHSYSYGYTVPQLVTGVLGDYKLSDTFSVQAGFHRGWMMFEDNNDQLDVMGGIKWASRDKRTSLAYAFSAGPQDPAGDQCRFVYSLVGQHQLTEKLRYVLVHNWGSENNGAPDGSDAEWYGLNQYFLYNINPCWSANLRVEWLRDVDGTRIAGPGNIPGVRAFSGRGFAGDFYELTCGLNWRPHANITVRPELRWDWYNGAAGPTGLPFNSGTSDDQFLFGVDAVVTF